MACSLEKDCWWCMMIDFFTTVSMVIVIFKVKSITWCWSWSVVGLGLCWKRLLLVVVASDRRFHECPGGGIYPQSQVKCFCQANIEEAVKTLYLTLRMTAPRPSKSQTDYTAAPTTTTLITVFLKLRQNCTNILTDKQLKQTFTYILRPY